MSDFKSYREGSRTNWGSTSGAALTIEQINCGSMLRIADAVEKVAVRHTELMADRDRFKRWFNEEEQKNSRLNFQIRALKGQITKLKKAAALNSGAHL